ncbi:hypothetical protein V8F33_012498, partial [Rhypophila sp. PSN 637]
KRSDLSRDQRIGIKALHDFGHSYTEIAAHTGYSICQIQYAVNGPVTPQKLKPRHGQIRTPEKTFLKEWLKTGKNRYIPIENLLFYLPPPLNSFSRIALGRAIQSVGGHSKFRPRRIKLTQALKDERVDWCCRQLQLRPNPEDWEDVLFSDETWAVNDFMWKQRGILFDDEDEEQIEDWALERRRPKGWLFWGSFAGRRKGPFFFWEKEYGGINSDKYIFYI